MAKSALTPQEALQHLEAILVEIEREHKITQSLASKSKHLIEVVRSGLPKFQPSIVRRSGRNTTYQIEQIHGHDMLSEHRAGGRPLRVGRPAYDSVVACLANAKRGMRTGDIVAAVSAVSKDPPPDWQVRLVLRFLLSAKTAILLRTRAQYSPLEPLKFTASATLLWQQLSLDQRE